MIWESLEGERCVCDRPLQRALSAEREDVRFKGGEAAGWEGVALIVRCRCGMTTIIALSADSPRAA